MMMPGEYLKLRRQAAGLSIEDVVMLITPDEKRWPLAFLHTVLVEGGAATPSTSEVDSLRFAFPFDRYVLRQLIGSLDPQPEICVRCGCSALDACDHEAAGPCGWATAAHDLCTHCTTVGAPPEGD